MPRLAFDLRLIESFLVLAEEQHFGRAAHRLDLAQPGLSRQIHRLETQLWVVLFDRNAHGVTLTAAGAAFRGRAAASISAAREAAHAAQLAGRAVTGPLTLVVSPGVLAFVRPLLSAFAADHDQVELDTVSMTAAAAADAVRDGTVDAAIAWSDEQPPPGFEATSLLLRSVPVGVRLRADHALATLDRVPVERLAHLRLIMFSRDAGPEQHDRIVAAFGGADRPGGIEHAPRVGAARREMMRALDEHSFTVGPLALEEEDGAAGVIALPVEPPGPPGWLWLIWHGAPTAALSALCDLARGPAGRP